MLRNFQIFELWYNESAGDGGRHDFPHVPAPGAGRDPAGVLPEGLRALPADAQVRQVPQPRGRLGAQGPQALLPMARLCVRQVHPDRRKAEGDGSSGRAEEAAGPGGERGQGAGAAVSVPVGGRRTGGNGVRGAATDGQSQ